MKLEMFNSHGMKREFNSYGTVKTIDKIGRKETDGFSLACHERVAGTMVKVAFRGYFTSILWIFLIHFVDIFDPFCGYF